LTMPGGTTGVTEEHITAALAEVLTTRAEEFPGLAAAMQSVGDSRNEGLTFGLDRILDGLETLITARQR
jgi:hypothetical protein